MSSENKHSKKKIGPLVDERVWQNFRETVEERRGKTRGAVSDELETALKRYMGEDEVLSKLGTLESKIHVLDSRIHVLDSRMSEIESIAEKENG